MIEIQKKKRRAISQRKMNMQREMNTQRGINKRGILEDFFDFLFTVLMAFFAFIFIHLFLFKATAGELEIKNVKNIDFASDTLVAGQGIFMQRSFVDAKIPSLTSDYSFVDNMEKTIQSVERGVLQRKPGPPKIPRADREYIPLEGNLFSLHWKNTEYIDAITTESLKQGIDPCYGIVTVLHESSGEDDAVGNDVNVVGCVVQARRIFLMQESANCKSIYSDESALREDCLKNKLAVRESKWDRPQAGVNACLDDFVNLKEYNSPTPTQEEFCNKNGNFKPYLRYGIGLGQLTPEANKYEITIGDNTHTYCDLFDPLKNIEALVTQLKIKGASTASSPEEIQHVFGKYIGVATLTQGVDRYNDFLICKETIAKENMVS